MILNNTKTTGYSLGLPLWISGDTPSTGILQGITMTLQGSYTEVYLSKYTRQDNQISMTFSTSDQILCSVDATLSGEPQTFVLNRETSAGSVRFISGAVTLYDVGGDLDIDLTGAQVCPKYIQFIPATNTSGAVLEIIDSVASGATVVTTAQWADIVPETSVDVTMVSSGGAYTASANTLSPAEITISNTSLISYVNGSKVSGGVVINLGSGWVVSGGGICAKVGLLSDTPSCPEANYLEAKLNPGNYTHSCPLDMAFSGGVMDMSLIYKGKFNPEYESGGGLAWNQFSSQHDIFSGGSGAN